METNNNNQRWEDLIFENRNHQYGAYVIRKSYERSLAKGSAGGLFFAAAICLYPLFRSNDPIMEKAHHIICTLGILPPKIVLEGMPKKTPLRKYNPALVPVPTKDSVIEEHQSILAIQENGSPNGSATAIADIDAESIGELTDVVESTPAPSIFDSPEVMPKYKGGLQAMARFLEGNMRYPRKARNNGTEGRVFVRFVVNNEGKVVDAEIVKGISVDCDREAQRVISKMPDWIPGEQNHSPVSVRMIIPINFKLAE